MNKQLERMTIEEFAVLHDLTMYVVERHSTAGTYFLAAFEHHELQLLYRNGDKYPDTCIGQGSTPEHAIQNYAKRISNKTLYSKSTGQALVRCPVFTLKEYDLEFIK